MTLTVKVFDSDGGCVSSAEFRDLDYDGAGSATEEALWRAYQGEHELHTMIHPAGAPYVDATEYTVSILPPDWNDVMPDDRFHWELRVEYRGRGLWAVKNGPYCLGKDGTWDYEMRPSEREDEWLGKHRFDLNTALQLAVQHAPDIGVMGCTAREALDKYHRYQEEKKGERP